jgi:hypothetical protein
MTFQKRGNLKTKAILSAVFSVGCFFLSTAYADSEAGRLAVVNGDVRIARDEAVPGTPAKPNDTIKNSDVVKTGTNASAKILFTDQSIMDLGPNSALKISDYALKDGENRTGSFNLLYGKLRALVTNKVGPNGKVEVKSAGTVMGVRGTEFVVDTPKSSVGGPVVTPTVMVIAGLVQVRPPSGQIFSVGAGQMANAGATVEASSSPKSGVEKKSGSAETSANASKSSPVQQVSADQMQQALGNAKTEDNTFSNTLNLSASNGGGKSQARETLSQVGSFVANMSVPPPPSESGVNLNITPASSTQLTNFLPPVSIVPGNRVTVTVNVQ